MAKLLLTQAIVNDAKCEPGKRHTELCDTQVPGLMVYVSASQKSVAKFQLRAKNDNGTNEYLSIGSTSELSLAQARKLALQLKQSRVEKIAKVKSESAVAVEEVPKSELSLDSFMKLHVMPHCYAHLRSAKKYEQLYRIHVGPRFGHLPLREISRRDVEAFHNELLKKGQSPASADHSLKLLKRVMNLSVQWEFQERNVLKGVGLFNVFNGAENYLKGPEVDRLIEVLKTDSNRVVSLLLLFILSCGCRRSAAMQAKWSEIDFENRVWKIPAINSKSRRAASVPINDSLLYVLGQLDTRGKSEYLFVNKATSKPYTTVMRVWYRIRKKAGLSDNVRIHDLRHTWGSLLASQGISLYEISILMQHADQRSSARYAHVSMDRLQQTSNLGSRIIKSPATRPLDPAAVSDIVVQDAANAGSVIVPRVVAKAA